MVDCMRVDPKETSVAQSAMKHRAIGARFLPCVLRAPTVEELPALSALCCRSKAVWGYDADFMEACRRELTIEPTDLESSSVAVAEENGKIAGVAQFKLSGSQADLLKLFVEPAMLRRGVGRILFLWAANQATGKGADRLVIEADPDAAPFYRQMGAADCGLAPSGSIPGRMLPRLVKWLRSALKWPLRFVAPATSRPWPLSS